MDNDIGDKESEVKNFEEDNDNDVPDLVGNFDEASKNEAKEKCCRDYARDEVVEKVEKLKIKENL